MKSDALPVTIVGGYLGSGKTTLVNHLLRHSGDSRLAVLVNDFGELPIDADLIESEDGNVISLSGGCICCSYGNDLSMALMDISNQENSIDHLVIETSGVALPGAIASSLTLFQEFQLYSIMVLVNAETIRDQVKDRYIGDTIQRQLQNADVVIVNKCDLIDTDALQATIEWMQEIYPHTFHFTTEHARVPAEIFLDTKPEKLPEKLPVRLAGTFPHKSPISKIPTPGESGSSHLVEFPASTHDPSLFNSFTLNIDGVTNLHDLMHALTNKRLQLIRAKGYLVTTENQYKLIQIVGTRSHVHDVDRTPAAELIGKLACITLSHGATRNDLTELLLDLK